MSKLSWQFSLYDRDTFILYSSKSVCIILGTRYADAYFYAKPYPYQFAMYNSGKTNQMQMQASKELY